MLRVTQSAHTPRLETLNMTVPLNHKLLPPALYLRWDLLPHGAAQDLPPPAEPPLALSTAAGFYLQEMGCHG